MSSRQVGGGQGHPEARAPVGVVGERNRATVDVRQPGDDVQPEAVAGTVGTLLAQLEAIRPDRLGDAAAVVGDDDVDGAALVGRLDADRQVIGLVVGDGVLQGVREQLVDQPVGHDHEGVGD